MSLINDALKRAAEADKRQQGSRRRSGPRGPKGPEALGPPIEPVVAKRPRRVGFLFSPTFGLLMLIVILACVGAFFIHSWWTSRLRFVLQHLPPGVDPLEAMIVETRVKHKGGGKKMIVVSEKGATRQVAKKTDAPDPKALPAEPKTEPAAIKPKVKPVAIKPKAEPPATKILQVTPVEGGKTPEEVAADAKARLANAMAPTNVVATNIGSTNNAVMVATNRAAGGPVQIMPGKPKLAAAEFPEIQLGGIIIKKDSAIAYVNGKTLAMGDTVKGAELVEISLRWVIFEMKGIERKFYLAE
jgi:hypothetical protein